MGAAARTFHAAHHGAADRSVVVARAAARGRAGVGALNSQIAVDLLDVGFGQRADRLLELELVDQKVVVGLREVESRLEDLLLLVEHVEVRAHADLQAELVRVVRHLRRGERLLECLDLRDAAGHARERGLREQLRAAPRDFEVLPRAVLIRDRLAHAASSTNPPW